MSGNRPLPPRPLREPAARPMPERPMSTEEPTPPGLTPALLSALPPGVTHELIVQLAREVAAEMARSQSLPQRPPARAAAPARPAKPDARPMRFVYGAGAVAAMSVMAVGLVQPDFAATADQSASNDAAPTADTTANSQAAGAQVRHVVSYVQLQRGQTAPPGATVIAANAPAPRVVVTRSQPNNQAAAQPAPAARPAPRPATRQSGKPR